MSADQKLMQRSYNIVGISCMTGEEKQFNEVHDVLH